MDNFIAEIRRIAKKRIFYTGHAIEEMNLEKEVISPEEVREILFGGDIIEDYPDDKRGHSCLLILPAGDLYMLFALQKKSI